MTAVLLAVLALAFAPAVAQGATASTAGDGAKVIASKRVDSRLLELTIRTPALASDTRVRVLLPAGYAKAKQRRYPVLYLLHGASGNFTDWTVAGDAERTTAGKPVIVVMPDGGRGGWYTNWYNGGKGGKPEWERYHIDELISIVDRRYRTVAARRGRAIAGLSMGGFGAFSYAARHPDLFAYAASFSGGVDLNLKLGGLNAGEVAVDATAVQDGGEKGSVFGDFETDNIRWRGHNPPDLAANLRGLGLALYTGNGQPGGPFGNSTPDLIELGTHEMSARVDERLRKLGIAHLLDDYGPGAHTWPYWARDLRQVLPLILQRFAAPVAPPKRITYTSTESIYRVYGWRVALRRTGVQFSTLRRAGTRGFELAGSGRGTVTTPARYPPRAAYRVRIVHDGETAIRRLETDRAGRLRVAVRLAKNALQGRDTAKVVITPLHG